MEADESVRTDIDRVMRLMYRFPWPPPPNWGARVKREADRFHVLRDAGLPCGPAALFAVRRGLADIGVGSLTLNALPGGAL